MDFLKKFFQEPDPNNKKIQNLLLAMLLGIGVLLYGVNLFAGDTQKDRFQPPKVVEKDQETKAASIMNFGKKSDNEFERQLEERLESILSKIENAGDVQVMVTVESSKEIVVAKEENENNNRTREKDVEGGTREIQQEESQSKVVLQSEEGGNTKPVILREIQPKVLGVLILADGGEKPKVQANITEAVTTLLGLPVNKVQVIKKVK